jgi:excinuclease ABC subunit C
MSKRKENTELYDNKSEFPTELLEKLSSVPTVPGIYIYRNANGTIIYIGKAKNLRNRVRSYFQQGRPVDAKTKAMIGKITDLETIIVDSEAEALILEDTLVKKHKPRYNILLRDDKSYPYVRVTKEEYPRVFPTRNIIRDGSKYYGPFTDVRHLKRVMKVIRSLFRLRSCDYKIDQDTIEKKKYKICLDYHIDKCEGPCEGLISKDDYNQNVQNAVRILNGKTREFEKQLLDQMEQLSEEMKFEEAAVIKSQYLILREYLSHQKLVSADLIDRDVFGMSRIEGSACTLVFKIRDGKMTGRRHFIIPKAEGQSDERIMQSSVEKWYLETEFIPREVFLPLELEDDGFIQDWLRKKRGKAVDIFIPKLGDKKQLVSLASTNAEYLLRDYHIAIAKREQTTPKAVLSLQRDLRLSKPPVRIECFDNSHIQGSELVSSLVVFEDGKPKKSDYRKFKIKTVGKNDDFAAMREAVTRRYKRLKEEGAELPDLVIIDGGKGQLSAAYSILRELELEDKIPVIGLAKRLEEVFFPNVKDSILLPKTSSSLRLIQHLRDEAHRFAITFHRQLRDKRTLQTELTEIKGIGEKTAQKLLIEFGSVENIKKAEKIELLKLINHKQADSIIEFFEQKEKQHEES